MGLIKDITSKIKDILNKNPQGMTITQIARKTRINRNTVGRYLENLLVSGQVEMHRFGMKEDLRTFSAGRSLFNTLNLLRTGCADGQQSQDVYLCKRAIS